MAASVMPKVLRHPHSVFRPVGRGFQRFACGHHQDLHRGSFPPSSSLSRFRISSSWPLRAPAYFSSPRSVSFPRPNPRFFPRPSPSPRPCRRPAGTSALRVFFPSHFPSPLPVPGPFPCGPVPSPLGMSFLLSPSCRFFPPSGNPPSRLLQPPRQLPDYDPISPESSQGPWGSPFLPPPQAGPGGPFRSAHPSPPHAAARGFFRIPCRRFLHPLGDLSRTTALGTLATGETRPFHADGSAFDLEGLAVGQGLGNLAVGGPQDPAAGRA